MQLVRKAAFLCLWCFIFVLPWDMITEMPVLGSIPRLVGLIASAVGIVYVLARRNVRPLSRFHVFAALFVLWAGLSSYWSIDPEATRTRFLTYLQLLVLVWLIWELAWSAERQRALLQAYVLGACVAAVATISNYLSGVAYRAAESPELRFEALNQDPNELGLALALGLPMAWYLTLSQPGRRSARLWQLYLPLAGTAILLTASRASVVTAVVALGIIPWTQRRLAPRVKVALYAVVAASLVLASTFVPEESLERLKDIPADIADTYFGNARPRDAVRSHIWFAGLEVARQHPLVGVGAGAFGAAVEPALHLAWSSHNVPLQILVEGGLVGFGLFLGMVAAAFQALRPLPLLQRRFGVVLLLALAVGSLSIEWDDRKQFWFVLGILAAQVAHRPWAPIARADAPRRPPAGRVAARHA